MIASFIVAANIQGGQTTQSMVVPMQSCSNNSMPNTLFSKLEWTDYRSRSSNRKPCHFGNINALFLLNAGEQNVEFSADNSVALNAVLT
ncbi:hypothetical protein BH18THE2_BH18THE2_14310 [soil metagenome]